MSIPQPCSECGRPMPSRPLVLQEAQHDILPGSPGVLTLVAAGMALFAVSVPVALLLHWMAS